MTLARTAFVGAFAFVFVASTAVIRGQNTSTDWTQWRGANRDASGAFATPTTWPEQLTKKWMVDVGQGYATPLVIGNRVYVFARQGANEVMSALDAANGKVLWQTRYPVAVAMNAAAVRHGDGPKSTPAFADGKIFSIGTTGIVTAFDAATGKQVWQKPGTAPLPMYTNHAFSPLVDRGLVVFHLGGHDRGALTAFDVNTGATKWTWNGDGPGYGSPIVADLGGTRQIVTITQGKVVGVDAASGTLLWERPFVSSNFTNSMTPLLYGQTIIVGGAGGHTHAFTVSKANNRWATTNVWENVDVPLRLSNALVVGDTVFGLSGRNQGQYFSVDARTGRTLWTSEGRQAGQAAIVRAGTALLSLHDDGTLVVFRSASPAVERVRSYKVADSETWAQPAISGNRIFVKDVSTLALWTLN